jgi:hypothetical protein
VSKKKRRVKPIERRQIVNSRKKELMMACLIQNENAFRAVQDALDPTHFDRYNAGYAVVWRVVKGYYEEFGYLPEFEWVVTEMESVIDEDPDLMNDSEIESLDEFLTWAYDPKSFKHSMETNVQYGEWAAKTASRFLEERLTLQLQEQTQVEDTFPVNMPELLAKHVQEIESAASITGGQVNTFFPDGWDTKRTFDISTTRISFLDEFLGGGTVGGEVYGILGPFGSCKTTLAVMLVVEAAIKARTTVRKSDFKGKRPLLFIASYEGRRDEMQNRALGYAGKIARESIETMKNLNDLSKADALKNYERKIFGKKIRKGLKVSGELGRARGAIKWLNEFVVVLDMTGSDPDMRGAGNGYIKEISQLISTQLRIRGDHYCAGVVIDYVGAMVERHMEAHDITDDQRRHLIRGAGLKSKSNIADVFNCPVWLMHQLTGDANSRSVAARMHHTDAAECKSFAENLDFAFVLGVPNADNMCTLACTKHRRQPHMDTAVVRIDGGMNRVKSTNGRYVLDANTKKIISAENASAVPGEELDNVRMDTPASDTSGTDFRS